MPCAGRAQELNGTVEVEGCSIRTTVTIVRAAYTQTCTNSHRCTTTTMKRCTITVMRYGRWVYLERAVEVQHGSAMKVRVSWEKQKLDSLGRHCRARQSCENEGAEK